jgi:hypothetical protein
MMLMPLPLLLLILLQVSAAFALVLRSCGLLVNSVGGETQLDLATYTFSGQLLLLRLDNFCQLLAQLTGAAAAMAELQFACVFC